MEQSIPVQLTTLASSRVEETIQELSSWRGALPQGCLTAGLYFSLVQLFYSLAAMLHRTPNWGIPVGVQLVPATIG